MFIKLRSAAPIGLNCLPVDVEVDINKGQTNFGIIGLTDTAIQEAKDRIHSAIKNSGYKYPFNFRILVNLAPANLHKEGPMYDLPMAVGVILASITTQIKYNLEDTIMIGELALDGTLRPVNGVLSIVLFAKENGIKKIIIPLDNAQEASIIEGVEILPASNLKQVVGFILNENEIEPYTKKLSQNQEENFNLDMSQVKGQEQAKRALEIAAAGGHNILFSGPPGTGKTLLARALATVLPPLSRAEILEVTEIYSVTGLLQPGEVAKIDRPFRAPHHTASDIAMVGGGSNPRPGEISLAHRGVLFLDEIAEFSRPVLENLRQPLEGGQIVVSRASGSVAYPAKFILVAAMNPCPCGFAGDKDKACTCTPAMVWRYQRKLSGPLIDRFDLHVEVPRVPFDKLSGSEVAEATNLVQQRVNVARGRQRERFRKYNFLTNAEMDLKGLKEFGTLPSDAVELLRQAVNKFHLSARV